MKVYNLDDAMNWFLSNSEGTITCVCGKYWKEVSCFPEAVDFFNEFG